MSYKELIIILKSNTLPFRALAKEAKTLLYEAGKRNCLVADNKGGLHDNVFVECNAHEEWHKNLVYRLKPGWLPKGHVTEAEFLDQIGPAYDSGLPRDGVDHVLFNGPATIVFWKDGSKTVVRCHEDDKFDPVKGFLINFYMKQTGCNHREMSRWMDQMANAEEY